MQDKPTLKLKPSAKKGLSRPQKPGRKPTRRGAKPAHRSTLAEQPERAEQKDSSVQAESRLLGFHILNAVLHHHKTLDAAFSGQKHLEKLELRDRAFTRLLVSSCLRHYGQLNKIVSEHISDKTPEPVRLCLIIGACQMLFLNTSPHAAANTTVQLVKQIDFARQTGLTNAVMRNLSRAKQNLIDQLDPMDNIPPSWRKIWEKHYGRAAVEKIARLLIKRPALDLTAKADAEKLATTLKGDHISGQTVRCYSSGDITTMQGYETGEWWVQDVAAALPAQLLGDVKGKHIFDICAAPGGKTAQLIANGASVTAIDKDAARIKRLEENLQRLNMNADIICADMFNTHIKDIAAQKPVDAILLDAPCSATGTLRRRPDILLRKQELSIGALAEMQKKMLEHALQLVKPDGIVIYATCSLQPEEGEEVIEHIISKMGDKVALVPFTEDELDSFASSKASQGWARILPFALENADKITDTGNDGFFVARLRRMAGQFG